MSELAVQLDSGTKTYPCMNVTIAGTPSLSDISKLMQLINTATETIQGEYISVTDLSKLAVSKFLSNLEIHGMESTYKSLVAVKNPSIISFVILGDSQQYSGLLKETLTNINAQNAETAKYQYKYVFVENAEAIPQMAAKVLDTQPEKQTPAT